MLLQMLKLSNIRSYENLDLSFETGSTLLSGDIGSGKTTILLAIEFALFGVMRGYINASTLLRNGADAGKVYLKFEVNKDVIEIERSLKRGKNGISQGAGYISFNGDAVDGTAIELKSKVISLLGYPESLVSKSKNLLFRYTVYTPQEEMKAIIFDSAESRFEKLRTIFGIDKYSLIKSNAEFYAKNLRQELRGLDDSLSEIKQLQTQKSEIDETTKKVEIEIKQLQTQKENIHAKLKSLKSKISKADEDYQSIITKEQELSSLKLTIKSKESELSRLQNYLLRLTKEVSELENIKRPAKKPENIEDIDSSLKEFQEKLENITANELKARNNISRLQATKEMSDDIISKIWSLDNCPVCKQSVNDEHKRNVKLEEDKKISLAKTKIEKFTEYLEKAKSKKFEAESKISKLKELKTSRSYILKEWQRYERDLKSLETKKKEIASSKEHQEELKNELDELTLKSKKIDSWILSNTHVKKERDALSKEFDKFNKEFQEVLGKYNRSLERKSSLSERFEDVESRLKVLVRKRDQLQKKRVLESWINTHFTGVISDIEKEVFSNIHAQFNEIFRDWFDKLLEDETITVHLSEDFSPVISQNGHDIDVADLSGGEKTAVALAYRLSLNKVINDYVGTINTRDLIILDEPTDGFSSDQLDTLRDVFEHLDISQIIIVSHEKKLESMVDRIINIEKREHSSKVVTY